MRLPRASMGSNVGDGNGTQKEALPASSGQSTLEYALVVFAFLGVVVGLGAMWHMLDDGILVQHALQSASHHVSSVAPGAFSDVFMY